MSEEVRSWVRKGELRAARPSWGVAGSRGWQRKGWLGLNGRRRKKKGQARFMAHAALRSGAVPARPSMSPLMAAASLSQPLPRRAGGKQEQQTAVL